MKKYNMVLRGVVVLALLLVLTPAAHAAQAPQVLQVSAQGQRALFFTDSAVQPDGVTCKVSNQPAQLVETGTVSNGDAVVRTTVLVDISTSIPTNMRDSVIAAIDKLIEQKSPTDEYRLITFGQEEAELCDFTADRYDLGKSIQNIVFNGQWSMIYDAIYNTLPDLGAAADVPTLYRTIVITDGVDLTKTGVTMEELFLKLQADRCPVDVLAISAAPAEAANKELSAITRISGGRYCALDPNTDLAVLGQTLGVGNYSYIEVQVPEQLLDGSVRQVDLTFGPSSVSLDVKFPALYVQPESSEPEPTPSPTPVPMQTEAPVPAEPPSFLAQYGVICAVAAAVVIAVLIVVLVVVLKKKRSKKTQPVPSAMPVAGMRTAGQETTEFIGDVQYTVKISAPKHPGTEWVLEIADEALIGRADHCDVVLEDSTVSREHCKIVAHEDGLELIHLGSNRTVINGVKVTARSPLNSGDTLTVGREQLHIDYIQKLDGSSPEPGPKPDPSRQTEAFF